MWIKKISLFFVLVVLGSKVAYASTLKCDPRRFGAKGNGISDDTRAIQAAIDKCTDTGVRTRGGVVFLRNGVFLSGTIRLKSGVEFRIEPNATLKGLTADRSYPDLYPPARNRELKDCRKALIYAESVDGVKITGGGMIDGSGHHPAWVGPERTRPMGIFVATSRNVSINNIKLRDAGMWGVVTLESRSIRISKIDIDSTIFPNRDGIDIVDSHHVVIEDSVVKSGDDAVCLKSGSGVGVYDVTVRNLRIAGTGSNALKLGTASSGFFKKIRFENIQIDRADKAAIAFMSVDGGRIEGVHFRDIHFQNTGSALFALLGRRLLSMRVGCIDDVTIENVFGSTNQSWGSVISGTQGLFNEYKIGRIRLSNIHVKNGVPQKNFGYHPHEYWGQYPDPPMWGDLPTDSIYIRHADQVEMRDVEFQKP